MCISRSAGAMSEPFTPFVCVCVQASINPSLKFISLLHFPVRFYDIKDGLGWFLQLIEQQLTQSRELDLEYTVTLPIYARYPGKGFGCRAYRCLKCRVRRIGSLLPCARVCKDGYRRGRSLVVRFSCVGWDVLFGEERRWRWKVEFR